MVKNARNWVNHEKAKPALKKLEHLCKSAKTCTKVRIWKNRKICKKCDKKMGAFLTLTFCGRGGRAQNLGITGSI